MELLELEDQFFPDYEGIEIKSSSDEKVLYAPSFPDYEGIET